MKLAINLVLIPAYGALGAAIGTTVTLFAFNALKHLGLRPIGVRLMPAELLRVYLAIPGIAALILAIQLLLQPPLVIGLVLAGLGSYAVIRLARPALGAHEAFPRFMRLRVVRLVMGEGP